AAEPYIGIYTVVQLVFIGVLPIRRVRLRVRPAGCGAGWVGRMLQLSLRPLVLLLRGVLICADVRVRSVGVNRGPPGRSHGNAGWLHAGRSSGSSSSH
ncbi:hypothetical protein MRX96_039537, partial [Rhipicephalus microplus]